MDYIESVIKKGDEISESLSRLFSTTLQNSPYVDVITQGMNGIAVIRPPENYILVAHTAAGDKNERDIQNHVESMVKSLLEQANLLNAQPIGISDIIDTPFSDKNLIVDEIGQTLKKLADKNNFAILNGEYAICNTVNPEIKANISATMVSLVKTSSSTKPAPFHADNSYGFDAIFFDPNQKPVYLNSDGTGTKPNNFYTRNGNYHLALYDSVAMKLDDSIKIGATPIIVSDILETNNPDTISSTSLITNTVIEIEHSIPHELLYHVIIHDIGNRIIPYKPGETTLNVTGTAINTINEERLINPPKPQPGDYLLYIVKEPNGRSNGWTSKNEIMKEFGQEIYEKYKNKIKSPQDWHKTLEGKTFLEYLTKPSTILYPLYSQLLEKGLATSFHHLSGGAYNGKLAKPLSKHDLYVYIANLPNPPWIEKALMGMSGMSVKEAYSQWPMGVDGFVTTQKPEEAMRYIKSRGYDTGIAGQLRKAKSRKGIGIKTPFGKTIYFSGDR